VVGRGSLSPTLEVFRETTPGSERERVAIDVTDLALVTVEPGGTRPVATTLALNDEGRAGDAVAGRAGAVGLAGTSVERRPVSLLRREPNMGARLCRAGAADRPKWGSIRPHFTTVPDPSHGVTRWKLPTSPQRL